MYSRDYVYIRKYHVDQESNLMVLVSRAVEHPEVPESPDFVRVHNYQSEMVIRPHTTFDEWWLSDVSIVSGMPDFLDKLHLATLRAKNMEIKVRDYISARPQDCSSEGRASPERKPAAAHSTQQMDYA
ncbi:hypothetical protein AB205_0145430 [Aquarana catesbeiana]|uniref:START domain-containing protein n=1 Tax=Aquarana catesbeiana TaxID=8400 RepID=A0A2G9R9D6_AQUCT|nr:hypothetical protein AB205_0145430 [Aquarana catesbeiana]